MSRASRMVPIALFASLAAIPILREAGLPIGGFLPLIAGRIIIFAIAAMSLDFILGVGGLASFGHAAPLAIGAYAVAILDAAGIHDATIVIPAAMLAAGIFALVTGAIALRTSGINFLMITLAFAQMVYFAAGSLADYGGDDGYSLDARIMWAGWKLSGRGGLYAVSLVCLFAAWLLFRTLTASRFGRLLSAARQNRVRVQSMGVDVFAVQLTSMVIAAMVCAVAGVLLANEAEFVSPAYAAWGRSGSLMVMVLLGGAGSLHGAILGAALVVLFEEGLGRVTPHWPLIFGPLLVLSVLFLRRGIAGIGRGDG